MLNGDTAADDDEMGFAADDDMGFDVIIVDDG